MKQLLQVQGIHHITLNGANRKTSIDFWQNTLGLKLIFEQPNLDDLSINHLYFDCGDGRTITVFTSENRKPKKIKNTNEIGTVHHIAFWVSQSIINLAAKKLKEKNISNTGIKDRGFMESIYFREPLGLLIELSSYKFIPPPNYTHGQVLEKANDFRIKRNGLNLGDEDILSALKYLTQNE